VLQTLGSYFPLKFQANVRAKSDDPKIHIRIGSDGVVHGLPKLGDEADSETRASDTKEAVDDERDSESNFAASQEKIVADANQHQLSGDKERESTGDYFDRLQKEELKNVAARRAIRAKRAVEMAREKQKEFERIDQEVAHSPGAGRSGPINNTVDGVVKVGAHTKT